MPVTATRGCSYEQKAIEDYKILQEKMHTTFQVKSSGFVIHQDHQYIGASPDGVAFCDCCSLGCVEIKCPYCAKDGEIEQVLELKNSMLKAADGAIKLTRYHFYYYQVQTQIHVLGTKYADFVAWTQKIFVGRILPDSALWSDILLKSEMFVKKCNLPELIRKFY